MKKEKTIRTYQRRTKSGKVVTVKQHTAKYDAAEKAKEAAKKKGAGSELEDIKKKKVSDIDESILNSKEWGEFENNFEEGWTGDSEVPTLANLAHHRQVAAATAHELAKKYKNQDEFYNQKGSASIMNKLYAKMAKKLFPKDKVWYGNESENPNFWKEKDAAKKQKSPKVSESAATKSSSPKSSSGNESFTRDDFKEWYRGTGSEADKRVAKILKKQLGRSGYKKLEDEAIDNYSSRGHLSMFKRVSSDSAKTPTKETKGASAKASSESTKKSSKDLAATIKEVNAKLKEKATKTLTYNGRKYYVMDSRGVVKYVDDNGKTRYYIPRGAKVSPAVALKNQIDRSKKEAKAKKDAADLKAYREKEKSAPKKAPKEVTEKAQTERKKASQKIAREQKSQYRDLAEKKGLTFVGTRGGVMVFHKNGRPYIAKNGKVTTLGAKDYKSYVSKKLEALENNPTKIQLVPRWLTEKTKPSSHYGTSFTYEGIIPMPKTHRSRLDEQPTDLKVFVDKWRSGRGFSIKVQRGNNEPRYFQSNTLEGIEKKLPRLEGSRTTIAPEKI